MHSASRLRRVEPIPVLVVSVTAVVVVAGFTSTGLWQITRDDSWLPLFFDYLGALFLVSAALLNFTLAVIVWGQFGRHEPIRKAWLLLSMAGLLRLTSVTMTQILGRPSYLNPLYIASSRWDPRFGAWLARLGSQIAGPWEMLLWSMGLFAALRTYRRVKVLADLTWSDWCLIALIGVYGVYQVCEFFYWTILGHPQSLSWTSGWLTDPLLAILLFEAVMMRRSALAMGWGLIAKSWGAYATAILLTAIGDASLWASNSNYLGWQQGAPFWLLWFPAAGALALGPAYQLQAIYRARAGGPSFRAMSERNRNPVAPC